jgi:hypothetical protein
MNPEVDQATEPAETMQPSAESRVIRIDVPSILMLAGAVIVIAWSFWPGANSEPKETVRIAVGTMSPPLRCVDPATGEPLLALVPRGWFVWLVLGPEGDSDGHRLRAEIEKLEPVWNSMADMDQWRRVIVTEQANVAAELDLHGIGPKEIPMAIGLRRKDRPDSWQGAQRVRHILIEPTGRILMIEPAETDHPGGLDKIRNDLRRRLRAWEGEFDDLPRFS